MGRRYCRVRAATRQNDFTPSADRRPGREHVCRMPSEGAECVEVSERSKADAEEATLLKPVASSASVVRVPLFRPRPRPRHRVIVSEERRARSASSQTLFSPCPLAL